MSTVSALSCPRCGDKLIPVSSIHRCLSCDGALIPQSRLQPLLRALTEDLKNEELVNENCLHDVIVAIPDKDGDIDCPQCGSRMDNHGYLSTNKVMIDGCLKCGLVWTDADELGVMAAIHARSMESIEEAEQARRQSDDEDSHFRAMLRIRRSFRRLRF